MAKVTGQTIDPALEALYLAITSPGKIEQGPDGDIRVKKGKKAPKRKQSHNLDLEAFRYIAEQVAEALNFTPGAADFNAQVFTILQELAVGYINPEYFKKCPVVSAVTLESSPISVEDPAPPPYGFRTVNNWPTLPTYPDGTPTASPPGYAGAKVDTLFKDTYLRWRKIAFTAASIKETAGEKKVLLRWNTTISIAAGSRGSRPMLSLNVKGSICGEFGSDMDSTTPPLLKKTSLYWRFKIPPSTPPYYNSYQVRNIVKPFARFAKKSGGGLFSYYLLNASNRPMAGRGFNNNDNVETSFSGDPELWEIKKCLAGGISNWNLQTPPRVRDFLSVAWSPELQLFAAVATGTTTYRIMTSPDGFTWTSLTQGAKTPYKFICWAPMLGKFIAVGGNTSASYVLYSSNGVVWNVADPSHKAQWTNVIAAPELGLLVAVSEYGAGGSVMTSTNGTSWTALPAAPAAVWRGLTWSPELGIFVAVSDGFSEPKVMTSSNGINWTPRYGAPGLGWESVTWSPELGLFVAVSGSSLQGYVITSPDGINWTARAITPGANFYCVTWSPDLGIFVAVGNHPEGMNVMTSSDGIIWTMHQGASNDYWRGIAWAPDLCRFAAVSAFGASNPVMTSD